MFFFEWPLEKLPGIRNDLLLHAQAHVYTNGQRTHIHMSIQVTMDRLSSIDDSDPNRLGLSHTAYHFIGGLFEHAHALAALVAPSVNSYKRLVVGRALSGATWAPAHIAYGDNNRTAMVRGAVWTSGVETQRFELQSLSGYRSGCVAGLDGIDRKLDPGLPQNVNLYDYSIRQLRTWHSDVAANSARGPGCVGKDTLFSRQLGQDFIREFIEVKDMEWIEYNDTFPTWEIQRYLEYY